MPIRVLIADDFAAWRDFVSSTLKRETNCHVVAESSDGLEATQKAEEIQPDLIVLDIGLPMLDGLEVARRVSKLAPNTKILFLSAESDIDVVMEALSLGTAYIHKPRTQLDLLPALQAVVRNERFVSDGLLQSLPSSLLALDLHSALSEVLALAIEMSGANMGSLQVLDPQTNTLQIAAHSGFSPAFLEFYDKVRHNLVTSCTTALSRGQRVIVNDVAHDPIFQGTATVETILGKAFGPSNRFLSKRPPV